MKIKTNRRCRYCGRYFKPDYRNRGTQKCCRRTECAQQRKGDAQKKWVRANPGYFNGRYENTKRWRMEHPEYQKTWQAGNRDKIQDDCPSRSSLLSLVWAPLGNGIKDKIQDDCTLCKPLKTLLSHLWTAQKDTRRHCPP